MTAARDSCGRIILALGLIVAVFIGGWSDRRPVMAQSGPPPMAVSGAAQDRPEKSYLERLFGNLAGPAATTSSKGEMSGWEWLLAGLATLFYGPIALLAILWILFTSDPVGIVCGLFIIATGLAFSLPRRSRPVSLVVLASLGFLLAAGITLVVAVEEGVPWVLVSLLPAGLPVWLAVRPVLARK